MDINTWKTKVQEKMQRLGHWLNQPVTGPTMVYGTLTGLTLWPLVEAAAHDGSLSSVLPSLLTVGANIGMNLAATEIEKWKDQKPTEAEVIAWTSAQANNPEARDFMDEMIAKLDAMQAAQPTLTAHPEWQQQLLDELKRLGNLPRFEATLNAPGFIIQGKNKIEELHYTVIEKPVIHVTPPPTPDPAEQARKDYLENLIRYCSQLPIAALSGDETTGQELSLTQVYVDLNTTTHIPLTEQEKKQQRDQVDPFQGSNERIVTAWEAAQQHPRLVLLGDPGSGKSSFVRYLAMRLAEDLRKPYNLLRQPPPLLPVLVTLRDLARRLKPLKLPLTLPLAERDKRLMKAIWQQWQADLGHYKAAPFAQDLERVMGRGNVLLILDGLDEVAEDTRERVQQAVFALLRRYPRLAHIIITCRSRSWRSDLFPGFKDYTLAPFTEKQIDQFITLWYKEQTRPPISRFSDEDAGRRSQDLQVAVRGNDLWKLAGNPMLLTTMALVHQRETKLPDERVKLFTQAVKVLVERWQGQSKEWQVSDSLREWLNQEHRWRPALERLAYEAQTRQANLSQLLSENDQPGDLTVEQIITILRSPAYLGSVTLAGEFLDYVDQRAGLLVGRGGQVGEDHAFAYTFPHRTFQEYLAGCHLITGRRISSVIRPLAEQGDFWAVAVQLGAEELLYNKRDKEKFLDLAYALCPADSPQTQADWRRLLWSGAMAVRIGEAEIQNDQAEEDSGYLQRLTPRLTQALRGYDPSQPSPRISQSSTLPPRDRAQAGDLLAALGEPERPEVLNCDEMPLCYVPPGEFWMGDEQKETRGHWNNSLNKPYWLAQYPVTVAQFRQFVQDSGFQPSYGESLWGVLNCPVVYVNWYDALAFCDWLTRRWQKQLPPGYCVTLPSEAEWEKAARGGKLIPATIQPDTMATLRSTITSPPSTRDNDLPKRQYPWGNQPEPETLRPDVVIYRGNSAVAGIGRAAAVGGFPAGASPYGCLDMAGNVWEWTRSCYGKNYPYQSTAAYETIDPNSRQDMIVRGGSFYSSTKHVLCSTRDWGNPVSGIVGSWGFRVGVASPVITSGL